MPHIDPNLPLTPSVLDRLMDPATVGARGGAGLTLEQMLAAVQRDLEHLLNSRQSDVNLPVEYSEVRNSIVVYGLPDLTSVPVQTTTEREEMARMLGAIVSRFEPRLREVRVHLLESGMEQKSRALRFRIEARLCVEPSPEVAFDTLLELTTGRYSIRQREG
jgi:type VI secretion system protein ImpF